MVQPYRIPTAPPGACSAALETGDPLAGVAIPVLGNPSAAAGFYWHPQDELFLNWFARDGEARRLAPADGRYTFNPTTPSIGGPYAAFGYSARACLAAP